MSDERGYPRELIDMLAETSSGVEALPGGDVRIVWTICRSSERDVVREASRRCGGHLLLRQLAEAGWFRGGEQEHAMSLLRTLQMIAFCYGSPSLVRSSGVGGLEALWLPTVWREPGTWLAVEIVPGDLAIWGRIYRAGRLVRKRRLDFWG